MSIVKSLRHVDGHHGLFDARDRKEWKSLPYDREKTEYSLIRIMNYRKEGVNVSWIDPEGNAVFYAHLENTEKAHYTTALLAVWRFDDPKTGKVLKYYITGPDINNLDFWKPTDDEIYDEWIKEKMKKVNLIKAEDREKKEIRK